MFTRRLQRCIDRVLMSVFKIGGTVLCIPCALPIPWSVRLNYNRLLQRILHRELTDETSWLFFKYFKLVIAGQNEKYGVGKTLSEYFERSRFEDGHQPQNLAQEITLETITTYIREHFPSPEKESQAACVQFTGGKDSTLALSVASTFHRGNIHLLSFRNGLLKDVNKVYQNIGVLTEIFGPIYQLIPIVIEELIKEIYLRDYWNDLRKYKLEMAGFFCGSCRLAMHTETILYCLKNRIAVAYDGANATGFDLSQRPWFPDRLRKFYKEFGITYATPAMTVRMSSKVLTEILGEGIRGSQPTCMGGGKGHNTLWRCYSLDRYGREGHERILRKWTEERLEICREYIKKFNPLI